MTMVIICVCIYICGMYLGLGLLYKLKSPCNSFDMYVGFDKNNVLR